MDIKTLLTQVSEDRQGSFDRFFNIYYNQVFRFAFYYLKDKKACREVVSDVFFSVWQSRKKLVHIENIETYLYVVARNEVNRYLNKREKHSYFSLEQIPVQLEKVEQGSPENILFTKEIEELLSKAISELPEKCRIIFLMIREERLKPKEIAEILSIQESTVRVQVKIAIEKMTSYLKSYFPDLKLSLLLMIFFN